MRTNRRETRKAGAAIVSDLHLRDDQPICRTDDYWKAQLEKLEFIVQDTNELVAEDGPLIIAGDLFDYWRPSPLLIAETIRIMNKCGHKILAVAGQHDIPQHNLDLYPKTGLRVLEEGGVITLLRAGSFMSFGKEEDAFKVYGYCFGEEDRAGLTTFIGSPRTVGVFHFLTCLDKSPIPGVEIPRAKNVLKKFPQFNLMIVGDNHQCFQAMLDDQHRLCSPGSMTRMEADQEDYEPQITLYYPGTNTVEWHPIPVKAGVITRKHIERLQGKQEDIAKFVEGMKGSFDQTVSFERNLERYWKRNKIGQDLKEIVLKALEEETEE